MESDQIFSEATPNYLYVIFVAFLFLNIIILSILLYQWILYPELRGIHFNFICMMAVCQGLISVVWLILILLNFSLDLNFITTLNQSYQNKIYCPISTFLIFFAITFLFYCSIIITILNLYTVLRKTFNQKRIYYISIGFLIFSFLFSLSLGVSCLSIQYSLDYFPYYEILCGKSLSDYFISFIIDYIQFIYAFLCCIFNLIIPIFMCY